MRLLLLSTRLKITSIFRQHFLAASFHKGTRKRRTFPSWTKNRAENSDSDVEPVYEAALKNLEDLQAEVIHDEVEDVDMIDWGEDEDEGSHEQEEKPLFPDYRIPHRFVGFDPRRMDLEDFPRLRIDFDGKRSNLIWMGTECQKCGLQIRREKRTKRESSLNVYANGNIPEDLLRSCPEKKIYPLLWRTRDPYVALDILAVEDY